MQPQGANVGPMGAMAETCGRIATLSLHDDVSAETLEGSGGWGRPHLPERPTLATCGRRTLPRDCCYAGWTAARAPSSCVSTADFDVPPGVARLSAERVQSNTSCTSSSKSGWMAR